MGQLCKATSKSLAMNLVHIMFIEMKFEMHNMSENKSKREKTLEAIMMLNFSTNNLLG